MAFEIFLHTHATKPRSLGQGPPAGATAEFGRAEHVLPRRHRLLENLHLDFAIEGVVSANVAPVGSRSVPVPEVLSQGE